MLLPSEVVLVFDTDGTLLDGRQAVVAAVAEGLINTYSHFNLQISNPDLARISDAIGLPATEFFSAAFDPDTVPASLQTQFAGEFEIHSTRAEVAAIECGKTNLYEGTEETLATLVKRGYPMALFSNANARYFETVVRVHRLDRFFEKTISLEKAIHTRLAHTKAEIVQHLAQGYPAAVVIGDRIHDIDAGKSAGASTVGCLFGFGKVSEFDQARWTINCPQEILELPLTTPLSQGGGRIAGRQEGKQDG